MIWNTLFLQRFMFYVLAVDSITDNYPLIAHRTNIFNNIAMKRQFITVERNSSNLPIKHQNPRKDEIVKKCKAIYVFNNLDKSIIKMKLVGKTYANLLNKLK